MTVYYFDTSDGTDLIVDDIGLDLPDLEAVKLEAAQGLADLARDVIPASARRELFVQVRDHLSRQVLKTTMVFEVVTIIGLP